MKTTPSVQDFVRAHAAYKKEQKAKVMRRVRNIIELIIFTGLYVGLISAIVG